VDSKKYGVMLHGTRAGCALTSTDAQLEMQPFNHPVFGATSWSRHPLRPSRPLHVQEDVRMPRCIHACDVPQTRVGLARLEGHSNVIRMERMHELIYQMIHAQA
jgi:hypothetical protein